VALLLVCSLDNWRLWTNAWSCICGVLP